MKEEYPNDKETQEWMNAPLGVPDVERCKDCGWPLAKSVEEGCVIGNCSMRPIPKKHAEISIKFWSDKYDAKVDELHEMWKEARSFQGSFNSATKRIAQQMEIIDRLTKETFEFKKEIAHLKESRSKWAKQSSENADDLDKALASWHMKCVRLEDKIDLMCDEFKRIKSLTDNQEIKGLCERGIQDIQQNVSVIAQRDNAEAREIVLRRNLENAYAEAQRIYPEFDWDGFTQTSEIIVMALYDKIKMQGEKIKAMEAVIYAVGDYASNHKDDRFGSRRRLLEAYAAYQKVTSAVAPRQKRENDPA